MVRHVRDSHADLDFVGDLAREIRGLGAVQDCDAHEAAIANRLQPFLGRFRSHPQCATSLLVKLGHTSRFVVIQVLEVLRKGNLQQNEFHCSSVVAACGKECDWENALEHLQYCLAGSVQLNEACYNAAVHACRKDWQRALCFLSSMCSLSLRSSRTSCNSLLHASTVTTGAPSSLHQWALALSQLTGFAKMQIRSDSYTLTTIGAACALNKVGQKQWQHAYLFHRFHKGQRNVFSHNSLLCACERASCWEMVVAMVMDPSAPVSTVISFNTAIAASSAAHGNWRHGLCMFVAIATFELSRSISSYNALAAGLRRMLCWRQSLVFLLDSSRSAALVPDAVSMLSAVTSPELHWTMAASLLDSTFSLGTFQISTLNAMVDTLREASEWRFGLSLLSVMAQVRAMHDRVTSNTLLALLSEAARWELAFHWLQRDLVPDGFSATALATGLAGARRWQDALALMFMLGRLRVSKELGEPRSATIAACCGRWHLVLGLMSCQLNVVTYNAALSACAAAAAWQATMSLLEAMGPLRLVADIISHTAVLDSCVSPSLWRSSLCQRKLIQTNRLRLDGLSLSACVSACELSDQQGLTP